MQTTANYGLKKPEGTDVVSVDDFNGNADIIDIKLKEIDTALPLKAPLSSPAFTNIPTAPTAPVGTNTTQIANCIFVMNAIANLVNSSPSALDTLKELAAALGNDANFATTITNALALKASLVSPAFTGAPTAPTATTGTNSTQVANTAFVNNALSPITADLSELAKQNLLINGDFQVWQRGTNFASPNGNTYFADRWNLSSFGSAVDPNAHCVVSKVDDGLSLVCTGTTGVGNTIWRQPFENDAVKKLLGKTVTLSFSVKTSNIGQISVGFNVTSASGFENSVILKSSVGTSSDYVRYNATFTVPKTASIFMPQILLSVSGTSSYILKDVKLEIGALATPFEPRPYAEELMMCQRYYERYYLQWESGALFGRADGGVLNCIGINYKVEKRINPVIIDEPNTFCSRSATNCYADLSSKAISYECISTYNAKMIISATGLSDGLYMVYPQSGYTVKLDAEIY